MMLPSNIPLQNSETKINHYQKLFNEGQKLQNYKHHKRDFKLSAKEPKYLYNHHDQARLKLGLQDNYNKHQPFYFTSNSINFNNSIISRTFYLLMTFIALLIVITALSFGMREYQLSFKRKIKSRQSYYEVATTENLKLDSSWKSPKKIGENQLRKEDEVQSLKNVIQACGEAENLKSGTGLTKFLDIGGINGGLQPIQNKLNNKFKSNNWNFQKYKLTSNAMSLNGGSSSNQQQQSQQQQETEKSNKISGFSEKSITKYRKNFNNPTIISKDHYYNNKFTIEELMKSNQPQLNSIDFQNLITLGMQKIQVSQLLNCSIIIPKLRFSNAWQACNKIEEIRITLFESNDKFTKIFGLLQLSSIGKHDLVFDNPNIFLTSFNEFIEELIDSCIIFELFTLCNNWLQLLIIEFFLMYCWSHAKYQDSDSKCKIIKQQFIKWNLSKPTIQNKFLIFRILCNLYLGIKSLTTIKFLKENEIKLCIVLKDFIKHSLCNDYIHYLPMLIKAIDVSNNQEKLKIFFYEMIKILILKHKKCCMNEYLNNLNNFEFEKIIQYDLQQHLPSSLIYKKANEIYKILIDNSEFNLDDNNKKDKTNINIKNRMNSKISSQSWNLTSSNDEYASVENQVLSDAIPLSTEYAEKFFTPYKKLNSTPSQSKDELLKEKISNNNTLDLIKEEVIESNENEEDEEREEEEIDQFEDTKSNEINELNEYNSWQIGYLSNGQ
ncbi:hypothetical protein KGF54_000405 [Candida jiufengensis]|uniref:uncharacterized protein n=1 Tax=Candida jiufengensis TaxID=497108 RepID=UPI002225A367|nr:uncharacterized protein KGF54_000405 [Candida jiufengensis]KAI5956788.1 hypothetical protein KGF54_000405 [Candida jiufengensis]